MVADYNIALLKDALSPILYENGVVRMLDQRILPREETWIDYTDYRGVADAIFTMVVRGAPAIGVAAAFGVALAARELADGDATAFIPEFNRACDHLAATRPTAVNLFWAIDRMKRICTRNLDRSPKEVARILLDEACAIHMEDVAINRQMGLNGAPLFPEKARILTHCNAGALATGGYGTAIGVIRAVRDAGKVEMVYADETRPFLQGARLTAWELVHDQIPVTLICDNMAGAMMAKGLINAIVVGADRIAANGDVANKIGTYTVAVLAREHGIPFYVAAPLSTIDLKLADGSLIPIEERSSTEVTHHAGSRVAPEGVQVANPSFDVTPNRLVTGIITEKGVVQGDYRTGLRELFT